MPSATEKLWRYEYRHSERYIAQVANRYNIPSNVVKIMISRGLNQDDFEHFLAPSLRHAMPDPLHLRDMTRAAERLADALITGETIGIIGDYDVDGATSTALLVSYLRRCGGEYDYHIPDRMTEGYGPKSTMFDRFKEKNIQTVLTLDCGTTAFDALSHARGLGIDVIVIDHHSAEPKLPEAYAIVNPNRLDQETSPVRHLAAVGVVFLVLVALTRVLKARGFFTASVPAPDLLGDLDLVALGTVCDVVALTGLNRAFVVQGLKVMGLRKRLSLTVLQDMARLDAPPNAYHMGFVLGPRINAGGRVGASTLGTELLLEDQKKDAARQIATRLDIHNDERKQLEQETLKEAMEILTQDAKALAENHILHVSAAHWHPGVIGIVASRLKDRFNRPVFVTSFHQETQGQGSGRSMPGIDLGAMIQAAKQKGLLLGGGGHAMAGGITIDPEQVAEFNAFCHNYALALGPRQQPSITVDDAVALEALSLPYARGLERLAPFGQGNPTPNIMISHVKLTHVEVLKDIHMRCFFTSGTTTKSHAIMAFRAVGSPLGDFLEAHRRRYLDILVRVKVDQWMGREKLSITLEDAALEGAALQGQQHKKAA